MTSTEELAGHVVDVTYDRLPDDVREAAKRRILDALAVGLRNCETEPTAAVRRGTTDGRQDAVGSRLWGAGTTSAFRAALGNAVAVAAGNGPTFLSPTPAPAGGSIAAVLAAAEAHATTGEETLAGLAAALELHGELASHAPLDGLHPATHTAVAASAGVGRVRNLDSAELADALGHAASRVTLAIEGDGFAPIATGNAAASAVYAAAFAAEGLEAPDGIAAPGGWHDTVGPFDLDFDPGCERVLDAAVLPYDGHPYGQTAIEAAIRLANENALDPADIEAVVVETVDRAIPEIDPERIAAALVDRELTLHRDNRANVGPIAEATTVSVADGAFGDGDAEPTPVRVAVETHDGGVHESTVRRFEGDPASGASWGLLEEKFHALVEGTYGRERREEIIRTVRGFEAESPAELTRLLD